MLSDCKKKYAFYHSGPRHTTSSSLLQASVLESLWYLINYQGYMGNVCGSSYRDSQVPRVDSPIVDVGSRFISRLLLMTSTLVYIKFVLKVWCKCGLLGPIPKLKQFGNSSQEQILCSMFQVILDQDTCQGMEVNRLNLLGWRMKQTEFYNIEREQEK